ncbi:MAG: hypothetical protein Q8O99_03410 [bacterium]|nr:hypothetical protein [bacterium]
MGEVLTHYQPCVIKHDEKHDEIVYFNKRQLQQQGFLKDGGILKENQDQILLHARQK